jgi:ubiquinone/menaquinone biosynthesis C-methylase UbiE
MVKVAQRSFPSLAFEPADMLCLHYPDQSFGSAIAFYAIVHFDYDEIEKALREVHRILQPSGELLFSFHVGNEIISLETFLEKEVKIKFQFFEVEKVKAIATQIGFEILDILTRHPYPTEHATQRAYFWIKKGADL